MFALLLSNRLNFVTSAVVCKGKLCSFIVSSKFAFGGAMFCKSTDKTDMISRWFAFSTSTLLIKLSNRGIILSRPTEINSEVRLELLSLYLELVLAYWFVHVVLLISWRIQLFPLTVISPPHFDYLHRTCSIGYYDPQVRLPCSNQRLKTMILSNTILKYY